MKKPIQFGCMAMSLAMLVGMSALTGCSNSEDPIPEIQEEIVEDQNTEVSQEPEVDPQSIELSLPDTTILDQDGLLVKTTGIGYDSFYGLHVLGISVTNNTGRDMTLRSHSIAVNGIELNPDFDTDALNGETQEALLVIDTNKLMRHGITQFADLELDMYAIDNETRDMVAEINGFKVSFDNATEVQNMPAEAVSEMYRGHDIAISAVKLKDDGVFGTYLELFLENNTDEQIAVQVYELLVNGQSIPCLFDSNLGAGHKSFNTMTLLDQSLSDYGFESLDSVSINFMVRDGKMGTELFKTGPVELDIGSVNYEK